MDGVKFGDLFFDAGHQAASFCSISVRLTGSDGEACIACFFRLNSAMASIASFNVSCGNSLTWERPYFSQNLIDESSASSSSARRRLRSSIVMRIAPASSHSISWRPVCSVIGSVPVQFLDTLVCLSSLLFLFSRFFKLWLLLLPLNQSDLKGIVYEKEK